MTKIQLPANERAFADLRERARAGAGKASAPKSTSADQVRKPSLGAPTPKLEGPGSKTPEDPQPKDSAPVRSRDRGRREEPARIPEKAKTEEIPELEPELDLHDVFFGRRR